MAIQLFRPSQVPDPREMHNDPYYSDDDNSDSDTSDDVVPLTADEFPEYFQERDGRLFHSHGGCPYPLPVDAEEQQVSRTLFDSCYASSVISPGIYQRQNGINQLLRRLFGDYSVGPVRELFQFAPGEQRRVLDLGTGTGQWYVMSRVLLPTSSPTLTQIYRVLDMAREFPHVKFYGVDIGAFSSPAHILSRPPTHRDRSQSPLRRATPRAMFSSRCTTSRSGSATTRAAST